MEFYRKEDNLSKFQIKNKEDRNWTENYDFFSPFDKLKKNWDNMNKMNSLKIDNIFNYYQGLKNSSNEKTSELDFKNYLINE